MRKDGGRRSKGPHWDTLSSVSKVCARALRVNAKSQRFPLRILCSTVRYSINPAGQLLLQEALLAHYIGGLHQGYFEAAYYIHRAYARRSWKYCCREKGILISKKPSLRNSSSVI